VGVFEYLSPDGKVVREYRPPDEVLHEDSVQTLRDAPVTVLHPKGLVSPANWKSLAVGHVRTDSPMANEDRIQGQVVLSDGATIQRTLSKDLREVSCGYECAIDETPGVTPTGEKYDCIQRHIKYNHVAIGPERWGRQGASVALRLDSAGDQVPPETQKEIQVMKIKIKVDGTIHEVEAGSAEHVNLQARADAEQARTLAELQAKADASEALAKSEKERADKEAARADAAEKTIADDLKAKADASRAKLLDEAKKFLGDDYDPKDKTDEDIMADVIKAKNKDFKKDGKSPDYIRARYDLYKDMALGDGGNAGEQIVANIARGGAPRADGGKPPEKTLEQIKRDAREASAEAWRQPLTVTKSIPTA
jgi:hypothetical protein